jgi:uncharacterized small protein (DUF1192 family)
MDIKVSEFAEDLDMLDKQIKIMNDHLQTIAERQKHIAMLRSEIQFLQSIIDEQRRHA